MKVYSDSDKELAAAIRESSKEARASRQKNRGDSRDVSCDQDVESIEMRSCGNDNNNKVRSSVSKNQSKKTGTTKKKEKKCTMKVDINSDDSLQDCDEENDENNNNNDNDDFQYSIQHILGTRKLCASDWKIVCDNMSTKYNSMFN